MNGDGKWLSKAAVLWAFDDAPGVPARLMSTLLAVARYADEDGRGSFPSASTIALKTRKTERQAKRDLAELAELGLLLPGDKRIVADFRADKRPNVYDLAMPRGDTHDTPQSNHGVTPRVKRGDIQGLNGVSPMSPKEVLKTSRTARPRARAGGARSGTQSPYLAARDSGEDRRCAMCRSDDHQHCVYGQVDNGPYCPCWCYLRACPSCEAGRHSSYCQGDGPCCCPICKPIR